MPKLLKTLPLIKEFSKDACLWTLEGKSGRESLLLVVGCITSFQIVLVHFESLRIFVQPKDLNICFLNHGTYSKEENNFLFSSLVT